MSLTGVSGIHDRHHVGRRELVLDEVDQRFPHGHVVAAPHVVIVEQDDEQPDVRPGRLALLVRGVADLPLVGPSIWSSGSILTTVNCRSSAACHPPRPRTPPASSRGPGCPFLSLTITSTLTKLIPVRKSAPLRLLRSAGGVVAGGGAGGGGCGGVLRAAAGRARRRRPAPGCRRERAREKWCAHKHLDAPAGGAGLCPG